MYYGKRETIIEIHNKMNRKPTENNRKQAYFPKGSLILPNKYGTAPGCIMEKEKHLGLRIDAETHQKLKSLAEFDGRSINGEVLYLIRQAIIQHEQQQGPLK